MSGRYISFHRCLFGAVSVKPTGFLTNDSVLYEVLCRVNGGCCNHVARHAASIGRSLAGGFKTTPLAAYPPALRMALAGAVVDAFAFGRRRGRDQPFASVERPWKPIWEARALSFAHRAGEHRSSLHFAPGQFQT